MSPTDFTATWDQGTVKLQSMTKLGRDNFRDLMDLLPAAVYACDREGRVSYYNNAAVELWGWEPKLNEQMWCGWWRMYHPDGSPMPPDECPMSIALREGRGVHGQEIIIERPDGTRRHVLPHPQPVFVEHNGKREMIGVVNMLVDITHLKQTERALRESEDRYRRLIALMPAAVYTCAASGEITFFNERAAEFWGRRPKLGDMDDRFCGAFRLYKPDGQPLPHDQAPMAVTLREGVAFRNQEVVIERPDGSRISVLVSIDPIRDDQGRIVGAINVFHDTTSLKAAEKAKAHLAAIVNSSDDAIISKDLNGIIQSWNKGAERLFGYTAEEAIGRSIMMLIPPDRQAEEPLILQRLALGERVEHYDTVHICKDGTLLDISLTVSPVRDAQGKIVGASKIARDITERKRIEQELARHRDHLQALVQKRMSELALAQEKLMASERINSLGTIAAGLGHDIGNLIMPMAAHLSALENMILGASLNGREQDIDEHFRAIRKSFDYLRSLAGGLRMMATDPAKTQHVRAQTTVLAQWWQETHLLLQAALTGRFRLEQDVPTNFPPVQISKHLLTQAVFNLIQNAGQALAGQANGQVRVQAVLDESGKMVRLSVSDNGPGMTEEVRRRCVEPFFTTKGRGISTGLGLALVNGIVREAGGWLEIESEPNCGATFTLNLPISEMEQQAADDSAQTHRLRAAIDIQHPRLRATITHAMASSAMLVSDHNDALHAPDVLVIDDRPDSHATARRLLQQHSAARVVVISRQPTVGELPHDSDRVVTLRPDASIEALRQVFRNIARSLTMVV